MNININSENGITQGNACLECGRTFIYSDTNKCVNCSSRKSGLSTNMTLVNRRRKLQKENENKKLNSKNFYFED